MLDAAGDVKVYRVGQEGSVWYEGNAKKRFGLVGLCGHEEDFTR